VRADLLDGAGRAGLTVGAVCVYHDMVATAVQALEGSGIPVAAVSTGFPAGLTPYHLRLARSAKAWPPARRRSTSSSRAAMR
jgi:deoxyribose-phosphate aldolase